MARRADLNWPGVCRRLTAVLQSSSGTDVQPLIRRRLGPMESLLPRHTVVTAGTAPSG